MDENAAMMGDRVPPSPSPKLCFSSFLEEDDPINTEPVPQSPDKAKQSRISFETDSTLNRLPDAKKRGGLGDRIAARAGFSTPRLNTESIRSNDGSSNNDAKLPYIITIPPGISPTALLESPVFLSNSLTQASPTTGKFPFFPAGNLRGTAMVSSGQSREDFFDDVDGSSFEFKPHLDPGFPFSLGTRAVPHIDVTVRSENTLQNFIASEFQSHSEFPQPLRGKDETEGAPGTETRSLDTVSGTAEHSPPLSDQQDDEGEEQGGDDTVAGGSAAGVEDDGYNWRKYGQKQVKGSEFPRSYFKCTHLTCPVKKKVEKSREGHLTEIIYTGEHNHPKPTLNRRTSTGSNQFEDTDGPDNGGDNRHVWGAGQNGHPQWIENSNSLMSMNSELRRSSSPTLQIHNGAVAESGEAVDPSCGGDRQWRDKSHPRA